MSSVSVSVSGSSTRTSSCQRSVSPSTSTSPVSKSTPVWRTVSAWQPRSSPWSRVSSPTSSPSSAWSPRTASTTSSSRSCLATSMTRSISSHQTWLALPAPASPGTPTSTPPLLLICVPCPNSFLRLILPAPAWFISGQRIQVLVEFDSTHLSFQYQL